MSNLFFNPYKQFTGLFIPDWLLNLDCSMSSKFIYGTMVYYAGDKGIYNHGHDTIANKIGASEKTVRRGLQELIELHLIFRQQVGLNQNNRYYFIYRPQIMGINVTTDFGLDKLSDLDRTNMSDLKRTDPSDLDWTNMSGPSYSKEILDTSTTSSTENLRFKYNQNSNNPPSTNSSNERGQNNEHPWSENRYRWSENRYRGGQKSRRGWSKNPKENNINNNNTSTTTKGGLTEKVETVIAAFYRTMKWYKKYLNYFIYRPQIMGINVTTDFGLDIFVRSRVVRKAERG